VSALSIVIHPDHRGRRLSALALQAMRHLVQRAGVHDLIAPVRPSRKHEYPLIETDVYRRWTDTEGRTFDPWLRQHEVLGATCLGVAVASMVVEAPTTEWERWTGMAFPGAGTYVIRGALVPVVVSDKLVGRYVEPNIWMHHVLDAAIA
jgi:hypothetical protein